MKRLSLAFMDEAKDHARLAADIILLNTQNAIMAEDITGKILATFLGNTARFVKYLESVEPFSEEELSAFSLTQCLFVAPYQQTILQIK